MMRRSRHKRRFVIPLLIIILCIIFLPIVFHLNQNRITTLTIPYPPQQARILDEKAQHLETLPITADSLTPPMFKNQTPPQRLIPKLFSLKRNPKIIGHTFPTERDNQQERLKQAQIYNHAWVIQLDGFPDRQNANQLVHQLQSKGFNAFVVARAHNLKMTYEVYVGPFVHMKTAKTTQKQLKTTMQNAGIVVSFEAAQSL